MTIANRKAALETKISQAMNAEIELTVRGPYSFTVSTETVCADLGDKVKDYFGSFATISVEHDDETGSFAYIEVDKNISK